MPSNSQFSNNSGIPASILNDVMDMKMRESEKNIGNAERNRNLWEDNDFPMGEGDTDELLGMDARDDEDPEGYGPPDNNEGDPHQGGENDMPSGRVAEILDELLDQQRQMGNNVSSMELAISNIQEFLKSGSKDSNTKEIVESLKAILESASNANLELLEKKFSYFNKENIRQLFDQIDQRMRILNERDKSWQTSLEKASEALGKKVVFWSLVFSLGFSFVTGICFIMFYGAIRHILPLL